MKNFFRILFFIICLLPLSNCVQSIQPLKEHDSFVTPQVFTNQIKNNNQLTIGEIQGASHFSPYVNQKVSGIVGIVTFVDKKGFYLQSLENDENPLTSEGIYVHLRSPIFESINPGEVVSVSGIVEEFIPGGKNTNNLSITQLDANNVTLISSNNKLPEPIILGESGFIPPDKNIDDDLFTVFDLSDGIDFYESLEGMLIQVNDAIVVGPTNSNGEFVIVGDKGSLSSGKNLRGGITLNENDFNPERIFIDCKNIPVPLVSVGDLFIKPIIGVLGYDFGNYRIYPIESNVPEFYRLDKQQFFRHHEDDFTVATYNVENLSPLDEKSRFERLAKDIVISLDLPDVVALQEIQDNNGFINDDIVQADLTYQLIINEIKKISGVNYKYINIDPIDDMDGGMEGANIRVAFLFRTDRDLVFDQIISNNSNLSIVKPADSNNITLTPNPVVIGTNDPAFQNSRKPLITNFWIKNRNLIIVNNHWVSKSSESPLFGSVQPISISNQRHQQSEVVRNFILQILELAPDTWIIVLGDFNDYYFSSSVKNMLSQTNLVNPIENLNINERYNYIYQGNSQNLDNILVSRSLYHFSNDFQIIHINAEYPNATRFSDHDPILISFSLK